LSPPAGSPARPPLVELVELVDYCLVSGSSVGSLAYD
jgi:hypothetical protein